MLLFLSADTTPVSALQQLIQAITTCRITLEWMCMWRLTMQTENNHAKMEIKEVHKSFPARLPAGYSFLTLSELFSHAPEEQLRVPNILSQLRCEPATKRSPITAQHNTISPALPHTWKAVKVGGGPHRASWGWQTGGKHERKFLSGQVTSSLF